MNIKRSKSITIGLVCCDSDVPVVMFELNGSVFYGLIDTGSETTVFSKNIKELFDEKSSGSISIVGFSGKSVTDLKRVTRSIKFLDWKNDIFTTEVTGIVTDMSIISNHFQNISHFENELSAIFGSDFLSKLDAKVDYQHKKLILVEK